jgi:hypothetical protein
MADEQVVFDPFSIRSLLTLQGLDGDDSSTWRLSPFEKSLTPTTFALDIPQEEKLQTLRTDLFFLNLDDFSLSEIDSTTGSAVSTDTESDGGHPDGALPRIDDGDDVWAFLDVVHGSHKDGLLSWNDFVGEDRNPAYLSEAAGGYFEQALCISTRKDDQVQLKHPNPDTLQASLRELGLGRDSVFFYYDPIKATFSARSEASTPQDVSVDMLDHLVAGFLQLGNDMRTLRPSVKQSLVSLRTPVRLALSAAIGVAVHALESDMRLSSTTVTTCLQLREIIRKPSIMAASLRTLVEHCPEDAEDMAPFIQICDTLCGKYPWLRETLQEIVARSLSSQIEAIGRSVGLGTSIFFSTYLVSETSLTPVSKGSLPAEVREVLVESQEALALLRETSPDHQLFTCSTASRVNLQWDYSWESISKLQTRAMEYEASLKQAILGLQIPANPLLSDSPLHSLHRSGDSTEQHSNILREPGNPTSLNLSPPACKPGYPDLGIPAGLQTVPGKEVTCSQDYLFQVVSSALSGKNSQLFDLQPDLEQSLSLSLTPLLTAQHRLLSYSTLCLLFEVHDLQTHLLLQNRFQLLGDGVFTSQLTHALFDSSESSGEGMRKNGGRTGLRLQSRQSWPPASSELRLVLMGVLSESILIETNRRGDNTNLAVGFPARPAPRLESLSFAIRDLSDEDLEKCRDVDTIHALDFLTLQYKPPSALLETIITPRSLKLYDEIFIHLLRLLRVKSAAQELVTDVTTRSRSKRYAALPRNHKIRLEIHHFVLNLADWVQNTVIAQKWASFAANLDQVQKGLERRDYNGALEAGKGLKSITSLHEGVVDDIARTLFLKKRYTEVKTMLDRIFNFVLQLSKKIRMENADGENCKDAAVRRLHDSFRKEVKNFLAYLHSNSSGIQGERDPRGPAALMEQLALRLDMFGFYRDKS